MAETKAATLADVSCGSGVSLQEVLRRIRDDGIVVFPGLLSGANLESLSREFEEMVQQRHRLNYPVDEQAHLVTVRAQRDNLRQKGFEATADFFSQNFMSKLAAAYYGTKDVAVNHEIFINLNTHSPESPGKPPFVLHFDKRVVFKFFLYLDDTTASNGAMWVSPGTHKPNERVRKTAMQDAQDLNQIDNVLDEEAHPSFPIEGPAGTMFIFTTDVGHKAGAVEKGQKRRIMRGHSHSYDMLRRMGKMK